MEQSKENRKENIYSHLFEFFANLFIDCIKGHFVFASLLSVGSLSSNYLFGMKFAAFCLSSIAGQQSL